MARCIFSFASFLPAAESSTFMDGVSIIIIFLPSFCSVSRTALNIVGVSEKLPIIVSTPAFTKVSSMGLSVFVVEWCSFIIWSAAFEVWLQPAIQFVPIIILETDIPPTVVLGNIALICISLSFFL